MTLILVHLLALLFFSKSSLSQQNYDPTPCNSLEKHPGFRYSCDGTTLASCNSYVVYRSQQRFDTASKIAKLCGASENEVLHYNNLTDSSEILGMNREVLLPIKCSCAHGFFQANVSYTVSNNTHYKEIACDVFEGLVKAQTIIEVNQFKESDFKVGMNLTLPIKCACPSYSNSTGNGFQYLVTYPVFEYDEPIYIAKKFGIQVNDLLAQNSLNSLSTIFPYTTMLVPLRNLPTINYSNANLTYPSHQTPNLIPINPTANSIDSRQPNVCLVVPSIGVSFAFVILVGFVFLYKSKYRLKSSAVGSVITYDLPQDIVSEMLKFSLISYNIKELSEATRGFSDETKLNSSMHKGRLGEVDVLIKKTSFENAHVSINIHAKINHANIINLYGVCWGGSESSPSYLVFGLEHNGCLRDCLKRHKLQWQQRTQIALDVAMALHYIHHCTVPSYIHMNINSRNIFITDDYRAKIIGFGDGSVVNSLEDKCDVLIKIDGMVAPEYGQGFVSSKVDVFAFGVVLFELISGKEQDDSRSMTQFDFLKYFKGGGGLDRGGCLDLLTVIVDPNLREYDTEEVVCLINCAMGCLESEPLHRPSMEDILLIVGRMVH